MHNFKLLKCTNVGNQFKFKIFKIAYLHINQDGGGVLVKFTLRYKIKEIVTFIF